MKSVLVLIHTPTILSMMSISKLKNNVMTRKRDKIWTAIIATKQWFSKLFTSEADALVDDFDNSPPPDIGTQPYSGEDNKKGD